MTDIFSFIRRNADRHPGRPALVEGGLSLSCADLPAAIEEKESVLKALGCKVLAIEGDNGIDWMLWDLAALKSGVACIPLPPFFHSLQKNFVLEKAGVTHVANGRDIESTGILQPVALPDGVCKITFTSGTTGAPKGVCLMREAVENVSSSINNVLGEGFSNRHLCVLPLAVLLENVAGVYAALKSGATVHVEPLSSIGFRNIFSPDFEALLDSIVRIQATSVILVPELLRGLTGAVAAAGKKIDSLKFVAVGGAKVSPDAISRARALGLPVYEGYGLSECGSVVALNTPAHDVPGTVGRLLPHVRARFHGGEILVSAAGFAGYLGDDKIPPDFLATGDIGRIDDRGFVELQGRKKNILITSFGRNISPEWIEALLCEQPGVVQACVYGDGLPRPGALLAGDSEKFPEAVAAVNRRLPDYAQIAAHHHIPPIRTQDGLLTPNGRLKREKILARYQPLVTQENIHDVL